MKRPIVRYTMILNNLSEEEWHAYKLPPPESAKPRPNMQLPDLKDPLLPVPSGDIAAACHPHDGQVVHDPGDVSWSGDVNVPVQLVASATVVEVNGEGRWIGPTSASCHDVCFPGLGGEVVCLYDSIDSAHDENGAGKGVNVTAQCGAGHGWNGCCGGGDGGEVVSCGAEQFSGDESVVPKAPSPNDPVIRGPDPFNTKASEVCSSVQPRRSWDLGPLPPPPRLGPDLGVSIPPLTFPNILYK